MTRVVQLRLAETEAADTWDRPAPRPSSGTPVTARCVSHGRCRPEIASYRLQLRTVIVAVMAGIVVVLVTRQVPLAVLTTLVLAPAGSRRGVVLAATAGGSAVFEILRDHDDFERAEVEGAARRRGPSARAGSLAEVAHGEHGHAGRRAWSWRSWVGSTRLARPLMPRRHGPRDAFAREVNRRFVDLYGGVRPDLSDLHDRWAALPDGVPRRHVRECLAILEAEAAIDDGASRGRSSPRPDPRSVRSPCR